MNGLQHTHIVPNGPMLRRFIIAFLIFTLFLTGCSDYSWVGDGRGDWSVELCSGYSINRINNREILLVHKKSPSDPSNDIVINNYFITAYFLNKHFIMLEGIKTKEICISEEELSNRILSYYMIHIADDSIIGPFDSKEELFTQCALQNIPIDAWIVIEP